MKKAYASLFVFILIFVISFSAFAQNPVSNVLATQRRDGSKIVEVSYDLSGGQPQFIELYYTSDSVPSEYELAITCTGDFGPNVDPGTGKLILWDAGTDAPNSEIPDCRVRVQISRIQSSIYPVMISIPAGTFQMGDLSGEGNEQERPVHQVTLSAFEMGRTEVTQGQYQLLMGSNPSYFSGSNNLPVEKVEWYDAVRFCNKLSTAHGLLHCYDEVSWECDFSRNGYRLPTEAEWEYACRARTETLYNTGDSTSDLETAGWYSENSDNKTHPVGQKRVNAFGLFDMHGNVVEWCNDWYDEDYYETSPSADPTGSSTSISRVVRGGGWYRTAFGCRSANRGSTSPGYGYYGTGFRVVRRSSP